MVSFDFLSKPIEIPNDKISVLYIENQNLYRKTVAAFYASALEENNIIFSQNFNPINYKHICFVPDVFTLDFSTAFTKKIYSDLADYSNAYLSEDLTALKSNITGFLEKLSFAFDYDFDYNPQFDVVDLLKMQSFKPALNKDDLLSALLDYIILVKKYLAPKCFVMLNLHNCFSADELDTLYKELIYQNINILVVEGKKCFDTTFFEKVYIVDEDMCEIVE